MVGSEARNINCLNVKRPGRQRTRIEVHISQLYRYLRCRTHGLQNSLPVSGQTLLIHYSTHFGISLVWQQWWWRVKTISPAKPVLPCSVLDSLIFRDPDLVGLGLDPNSLFLKDFLDVSDDSQVWYPLLSAPVFCEARSFLLVYLFGLWVSEIKAKAMEIISGGKSYWLLLLMERLLHERWVWCFPFLLWTTKMLEERPSHTLLCQVSGEF